MQLFSTFQLLIAGRCLALIVFALSGLLSVEGFANEPTTPLGKARILIGKGDVFEKEGDSTKAIQKYAAALEILKAAPKSSSSKDAQTIQDQIKYCNQHITKNRQGADTGQKNKGIKTAKSEPSESSPKKSAKKTASSEPDLAKANSSKKQTLQTTNDDRLREQREIVRSNEELKESLQLAAAEVRKTNEMNDKRFQTLMKQNETLKDHLSDAEAELKRMSHFHSEEIHSLKKEFAKNEGEKTTTQVTEEQLRDLLSENRQLKEKLESLESGIKGIHSNIGELNSIKAELAATRTQLEMLQKENEVLKSVNPANEVTGEHLQTIINENNILKEKLGALDQHQAVQNENVLPAADLTNLQNQLEILRQEDVALKVAQATPKAPEEMVDEERFHSLETENNTLRQRLVKAETDLRNLYQTELVKTRELTVAKTPTQDEIQLAALSSENKALKERLIEFEKLRSNQNELISIKEQLVGAQAQVELLQRENSELKVSTASLVVTSPEMKQQENLSEEIKAVKSQPVEVDIAEQQPIETDPIQNEVAKLQAVLEVLPVAQELPPAGANEIAKISFSEPMTQSSYSGEVVIVNEKESFVVIDFHNKGIPPVNSHLGVYRDDDLTGSVRITEPFKPPFAPADILSGKLQRGDIIR